MSRPALSPIFSPKLQSHTIAHGFFTREGGVSDGLYHSLNCGPGSQDIPEHVTENRARITDYFRMPQESLITLAQAHGTKVVMLAADDTPATLQGVEADAIVTNRRGALLGILTADCCPVLFADPEAGVIGAAHAGWRGAIGGICIYTLAAMQKLGAKREHIIAAPGPCIGRMSYEVDSDFREQFLQQHAGHAAFFMPSTRSGHFRFDLQAYIRKQLQLAGINYVEMNQHNTYAEEQRFFSYRRATLRGEPDYGRQISVITLGPA